MRRALIALAALAATFFVVAAPASAADTGKVVVVHGVPGLTVDVYVNGDKTLPDFAPKTVTDPIELPAGDYKIDIRPAGADPASDPAISKTVTLPAGALATLVAHLDASGNPTLTPFVEDQSKTPAGQGRLAVRHTAAAPTVDVLAGGQAVITGLSNPESKTLTLPAGTVSASVAATGTTDPVIGPADVPVTAGKTTVVYAIGSLDASSLDVVVQTISVGEESATTTTAGSGSTTSVPVPNRVDTGDAGLAADRGSSFPWAPAGAVAAFAVAVAGLALVRLSAQRG